MLRVLDADDVDPSTVLRSAVLLPAAGTQRQHAFPLRVLVHVRHQFLEEIRFKIHKPPTYSAFKTYIVRQLAHAEHVNLRVPRVVHDHPAGLQRTFHRHGVHSLASVRLGPHAEARPGGQLEPDLLLADEVAAAHDQHVAANVPPQERLDLANRIRHALPLVLEAVLGGEVRRVQVQRMDVHVPELRVLFHRGRGPEVTGVEQVGPRGQLEQEEDRARAAGRYFLDF